MCKSGAVEIKRGVGDSDEPVGKCSCGPVVTIGIRQGADAGVRPDASVRGEIMRKLLVKLMKDETGGEVLEYALIAGLIVVAAIAIIGTVGTKVLARWTSLNSSL